MSSLHAWRRIRQDQVECAAFSDGTVAIYDFATGDTHCCAAIAAWALDQLNRSSMDEVALAAALQDTAFRDDLDALPGALSHLEHCRLIEACDE